MKSRERGACNCCENLQSIIDKHRRVRRRARRQPPRRASPIRCCVRRDDGEPYDVYGGEAQDDDVFWARDVSAPEDASPFDALERVWALDLYRREEPPSEGRRELHRQGREP